MRSADSGERGRLMSTNSSSEKMAGVCAPRCDRKSAEDRSEKESRISSSSSEEPTSERVPYESESPEEELSRCECDWLREWDCAEKKSQEASDEPGEGARRVEGMMLWNGTMASSERKGKGKGKEALEPEDRLGL